MMTQIVSFPKILEINFLKTPDLLIQKHTKMNIFET